MARGWESKSVESQIESAEGKRPATAPSKSAEQLRREQQRSSIQLSRTRVLHDLENVRHPRHRELLQAALKHLDEQLAALDNADEAH